MTDPLAALLSPVLARSSLFDALEQATSSAAERLTSTLARVRDETGFDLSSARVRAGFARGHLLDVVIHSPEFSEPRDTAEPAARELVAGLLGTRVHDAWIGEVRVAGMPKRPSLPVLNDSAGAGRAFALAELVHAVDAAVRGLYAGLPEKPCAERIESADWTLFELEPEVSADYALADDVVLATSMLPEMLKCFLQGLRFASERFSRHEELFCYVKYRTSLPSANARLAERTRLEDGLSALLSARGLGAVVGNALGLRYCYILLALRTPLATLEELSSKAVALGLPERAWLLFCDTELERVWLPLGQTSSPPCGLR